ncbi:hypothetical protein CVT25_006796, partial [Psilocybe cyanescens]
MPPKQQPTRPPSPFRQGPVPASCGACTAQPSHSATSSRQSSCHRTPTVTARDNTAQSSDAPSPVRTEDEDMEDSPTYLSLSYGDADVVEDSHRIMGALRTIVRYVNSTHIDLHSSPMGASLAQAVVDFTHETFNGDLGTTLTPDNILPIHAVVELFTAEDDTIRRPLAIGPTSPDPLHISSPPAWSDHRGAGDEDIIMTLAEPTRSSRRTKGKVRGPPLVPPSSSCPVCPTSRSYTDTARKAAPIKQPALPAAPPSRPPSRKGRKIPEYTAHGPSKGQLLINMREHPKDANLSTLFKDLYSVPTNKVPSERDTDILRGTITSHFKAHYKFTPWISMPTSKLFFMNCTHYDLDHLTKQDEVASALKASPIWSPSHILSCSGVIPSGYKPVQRALASPSALGAGGGAILLVAVMRLPLNACAALVLTSWRSTALLHLVAKGIQRRVFVSPTYSSRSLP